MAAQVAREIEIFGDRYLRDPADRFENAAPHEERLVSVRQPGPCSAALRAPFDDAHRERTLVEAQPEHAARDIWRRERRSHRIGPAERKTRVCVQEENHLGSGRAPARVELSGSTAGRRDHVGTDSPGAIGGPIEAASVDDDDLVGGSRARNGRLDRLRLVERRDHHCDPHAPTLAQPGPRLTPHPPLPYLFRVSTPDDPGRPESTTNPAASNPADGQSAPSYAQAGVDLDHDEGFVQEIARIARTTFRPEVLSGVGGFAGLFKTPDRYRDPILVASNDGVGTKLKLAAQLGRYDTVGIDCVAMVVNDLVVQGAEPLVFLDYLAMARLDTKIAADALRGIAEGCRRAGCALLGGETATMPGMYAEGDIELVGFGVGVVEREKVIDGSTISEGDVLIGIGSNGVHSNGFSLVRRVLEQGLRAGAVDLWAQVDELNGSLASVLLAPTKIYVKPVLNLIRDFSIKGIVHVTGGGFDGNVPRVLPQTVCARIDLGAWPRPPIFGWLQDHGEIADTEMLRVFNCGIGMILVVEPNQTDDVIERLHGLGERAYRIGAIERRQPDDAAVRYVRVRRSPSS